MDPEKPSCPRHGVREVSTIKGSNAREKWYACAYGDFKKVLRYEFATLGEVIGLDVWKKILDSLDNLGEIISEGGDDMEARAKREIDELGRVVAEEKQKQK